jgi:anion-transporting  ArsA/GET3 family ATPase
LYGKYCIFLKPSLDEIIALTLIIEHIDQCLYDMIIADAASIGHLLRLLEMTIATELAVEKTVEMLDSL